MSGSHGGDHVGGDSAAGRAQRDQPGPVRTAGVEQDRSDRHATPTQHRPRPQCITAVVTGADQQGHFAPRDAAGARVQFTGHHAGQSVCRAAHQGTVRQRVE